MVLLIRTWIPDPGSKRPSKEPAVCLMLSMRLERPSFHWLMILSAFEKTGIFWTWELIKDS